jgi:arylsulfatase A-like enzyme
MRRVVLAVAVLSLLGCSRGGVRRVDGVLLVTLDTCRSDRLGCYGNGGASTPALDRLAAEGILFTACGAPIPTTLSSHTSMLTSLYPRSHGVPRNGFAVPPGLRSVAEILVENGFRTAAFVGSFPLHRTFGLDRGFLVYDDEMEGTPEGGELERSAGAVTDRAAAWLAGVGSEPFFLWVHYFDPHWPYSPPRPYGEIRRVAPGVYDPASLDDLGTIRSGLFPFRREDRDAFFAAYDGEIAYVDRKLARLLDAVPAARREHLLVLVAGDHGEGFGEHDYFFDHGEFLWATGIDVPFILHAPALVPAPRIEESAVRLIDLAPTILEAAGIRSPAEFEGKSLLGAVHGPLAPRVTISEASKPWSLEMRGEYPNKYKAKSIRSGNWKLVVTPFLDRKELYDLGMDPREERNLYAAERDTAARLEESLLEWIREKDSRFRSEDLTAEDEVRRKLKALGYY